MRVVRELHAEHARPAVVAVLVFVHGVGRFHVVEEEFPVQAEHAEQAVVRVEGERAVVHAFGVVALLDKERHHGRKQPGLVLVIEYLQFAHAEREVAERHLVAVGVHVAIVQVFLAVAPAVHTEVGVGAKDAERAEHHVERDHVVRERELVHGKVVVVAGAPVQNVACQLDAREGVVEAEVGAVTGVAHVVHAAAVFVLDVEDFPVKAFGLALVAVGTARGVAFGIDACVEVEVEGVGVAPQVEPAIERRPDGVVHRLAAAVVDAENRGCCDGIRV